MWGAPGVGAEAAPSLGGKGTPPSTCASAFRAPKSPNHSAPGSPKPSPAPQRGRHPGHHTSRPGSCWACCSGVSILPSGGPSDSTAPPAPGQSRLWWTSGSTRVTSSSDPGTPTPMATDSPHRLCSTRRRQTPQVIHSKPQSGVPKDRTDGARRFIVRAAPWKGPGRVGQQAGDQQGPWGPSCLSPRTMMSAPV